MSVLGIIHWRHATIVSSIGAVEVCAPFEINGGEYEGLTGGQQIIVKTRIVEAIKNKLGRIQFPWPGQAEYGIEITRPMNPKGVPIGLAHAVFHIYPKHEPEYPRNVWLWNAKREQAKKGKTQ